MERMNLPPFLKFGHEKSASPQITPQVDAHVYRSLFFCKRKINGRRHSPFPFIYPNTITGLEPPQ
jgi:hypothetical protein